MLASHDVMGAYAFVERQKMGLSLEADGMPKLYKVRCRNIDLLPQNALFRLNGAHGSSANAACLGPAEDGRMYMFPTKVAVPGSEIFWDYHSKNLGYTCTCKGEKTSCTLSATGGMKLPRLKCPRNE